MQPDSHGNLEQNINLNPGGDVVPENAPSRGQFFQLTTGRQFHRVGKSEKQINHRGGDPCTPRMSHTPGGYGQKKCSRQVAGIFIQHHLSRIFLSEVLFRPQAEIDGKKSRRENNGQ